jgi:hypothetical protein
MQMCVNKHISIEGHGCSRHLYIIIPEMGVLKGKLHMLRKTKQIFLYNVTGFLKA